MNRVTGTVLKTLRASGNTCAAGLLGLLLHLVFTTAHLSAEAAALGHGGATGRPLGFLSLCTAAGVELLPLSGAPGEGQGGESFQQHCQICGSAAVSAAIDGAATVVSLAPFVGRFGQGLDYSCHEEIPQSDRLRHTITCRGPPLVSAIA